MRRHQMITRVVLLTTALAGAAGLASQARADNPQDQSDQPETQKPETQPNQPETQQPENQQPETQSAQPQTQRSRLTRTSATIENVDKASRMINLKGADGQSFSVQAGPNVDVNSLKAGEQVGITYYQEMAVSLENAPSGAQGAQTMTQRRTQANGVTSMQTTVTATVVSVNTSNNSVVLRGPHGLHTVQVQDPELQSRLHNIKPGQTVRMTYTEALATSIERRQ